MDQTQFETPDELRHLGEFRQFDKEELVAPAMGDRIFAYDSLTLADRWMLQMVAQHVRYEHDHRDEEGEDEDDAG